MHKITTYVGLTKKELCFLEQIAKKCKFSGGRKLSRSSILRAFLITASKFRIDVNKVKSEYELQERILKAFRRK